MNMEYFLLNRIWAEFFSAEKKLEDQLFLVDSLQLYGSGSIQQ